MKKVQVQSTNCLAEKASLVAKYMFKILES